MEDYELKNVNMSHGFPTQVKRALGWTLIDLCMHPFRRTENNAMDDAPTYWFSRHIYVNTSGKRNIIEYESAGTNGAYYEPLNICFITMPFGFVTQCAHDAAEKAVMERVGDYTNI
jgi:hypothetical protein